MTLPLGGFDKIAWLYDPLAKLVFGSRLWDAEQTYLHHIKAGARVLILGGGTGSILQSLMGRQPDCHVTYIDASTAMISRAQQRNVAGKIEYVHGDEGSIRASNYTVVITPFYMDMFDEPGLRAAIREINAHLAPSALWIATDFYPPGRWWDQVLLTLMYSFFRVATGIKANSLPDWRRSLELSGWVELESQTDGFIGSAVFLRGQSL